MVLSVNYKDYSYKDDTHISIYLLTYLSRDVVAVLKLEGPNYNGPLSPKKMGGPSILLLNKIPKNWGGPGPPGPLGDYIPDVFATVS